MRRKCFIIFLLVLLLALPVIVGCASREPAPPVDEQPQETGPQSGGILRGVRSTFPKVMSYAPEMGPTDSIFALPYAERLLTYDDGDTKIVPQLAKSWEEDPENLTITFFLQEGVQFHDGTAFNAEAAKWNFEQRLAANRLTDGQYVKSIEVVDEYTIRFHVTEYTNRLYFNYGWASMFSPTAFEKAGNGDVEASKEWARHNAVGTGPFKLVEFQRDNFIRYEKNQNYWREGKPYLDGIEIRFIPDAMTAKASLSAGEADIMLEVANIAHIAELESRGFKVNWGPGMMMSLLPSSSNPSSRWHDIRLREAVEYAIDREALANMIGLGEYEPLFQVAPKEWPGHVSGYNPRPYNPEKARELLADAGYPDGFETTILTSEVSLLRDTATAIQGYLKAVGITARVDIADMGRYNSQAFTEGWDELLLAQSGINPDSSDLLVHFGHDPMTFRTGDIYKSPEYLALCFNAIKAENQDDFLAYIRQAVRQAGEDAMTVPLFRTRQASVMADYVYSDYMEIHGIVWNVYEDWIKRP